MKIHRLLLGALLLLGVIGRPGAASGDTKKAQAKRAFARGVALFKKGEYVAATAAFERAYALRPHFMVLCNIARCHEQRAQMVEAAGHYQRCLDEGGAAGEGAAEIRASLAAVRRKITTLQITSSGATGAVLVDGRRRGTTPARVPVDPGSHTVELRWPGGRSASLVVRTPGGEDRNVVFDPRSATGDADRPARRGLSSAWFWTGVAATTALAAAAAVFGGLTLRDKGRFEDEPTRDNYDTAVGRRLVTNILAGLAIGVGAATTALYFFTDFGPRRGSEQPVAAGVGLRGVF